MPRGRTQGRIATATLGLAVLACSAAERAGTADPDPPQPWVQRSPPAAPWPGGPAPQVAYDRKRGKVVVFGGERIVEWDGRVGKWTDRTPPALPRLWRQLTAVLFPRPSIEYSAETGTFLLAPSFPVVWEWDGDRGLLTDRTPSPPPAGWPDHPTAIVVDPVRRTLVLIHYDGAVWEWRFPSGPWLRRRPEANGMVLESWEGALYDEGAGTVVAWGADETWEWHGGQGLLATDGMGLDPGANRREVRYDPARREPIAVTAGAQVRLWRWDRVQKQWTLLDVAQPPRFRWGWGLAQDLRRGRLVLWGGGRSLAGPDGTSDVLADDVLEWDLAARSWIEHPPMAAQARPTARRDPALIYDEARSRVLMFGGTVGGVPLTDVWEWAGASAGAPP